MYLKSFVVNPLQENTYLLYDDAGNAVIIDCGLYSEQEKNEFDDFIRDNNLIPKRLLNTHTHFDHTLGIPHIYEKFGLKPEYHIADNALINDQLKIFRMVISCDPILAEHFLEENEIITVGDISLKVLYTPGHSMGGLSFYAEKEGWLFSGDNLFLHDIGRSDTYDGNEQQLLSSIREKLLTLPGDTQVFSGHGPSTTIEEERKFNPYL